MLQHYTFICAIKNRQKRWELFKELAKIERFNLIVLDDFGLHPMDQQNRMAFLEIMEYGHGKGAMILTSQLPVSKWYEVIGEKTIADATMDSLVHNAHRVEITGESMRKKRINQDR